MSSKLSAINTIGVVGAGTMGSGIAQVAATAGYDILMCDIEQTLVERGLNQITQSLNKLSERDKLAQSPEKVTTRIQGTTTLSEFNNVDFVIEAVTEDIEVKKEVFTKLSNVAKDNVKLATNTSALSITEIASVTDRQHDVVGIHFMNPVPLMKGVEIVPGEYTSPATVELAHNFARDLGKETWESDDKPAFVTNRILLPWINEGVRTLDEGVASKEEIDRAMRLSTNVPMGPLEVADQIGLDVCLSILETLYQSYGDRYKPAYLLKRRVAAGDLGKKSGKGFYTYE